jgi:arylsulfatase A-like enzyme
VTAPVQLADIYPTLTDLTGLPDYEMAEGHSLSPLLHDPEAEWPYPALSFYGVGNVVVRDRQFRLIQYEDGSRELYDLANDPNEWVNLAYMDSYRDTIGRLAQWIPETWAPVSEYSRSKINPYFRSRQ